MSCKIGNVTFAVKHHTTGLKQEKLLKNKFHCWHFQVVCEYSEKLLYIKIFHND